MVSNETTLHAYFHSLNSVLLQHHLTFARTHSDFQEVEMLVIAEVKINGEKLLGYLDSPDGKPSIALCKRYLEVHA
jgi:hypothetical protein